MPPAEAGGIALWFEGCSSPTHPPFAPDRSQCRLPTARQPGRSRERVPSSLTDPQLWRIAS
jgi:hypothetical protein